ncbi:cytochrome P450 [Pseudarthrobacter oxydans]|uniref:cytochrome P450 n=1 Tax=Pseudarthrobacter oxydans TaxID=1671 RepID=UPI00382A1B7C
MTTDTAIPTNVPISDIDPFSDEFLTDPYRAHRELRAAGPVVWLERYRAWGVSHYQAVAQIFRDPETFCSSAGVGLTDFRKEEPWRSRSPLIESDPPEHTQARRVVTEVLSPVAVRQQKDHFMERATILVQELVERGSFDAVSDLGEAYPLEVVPDLFGVSKQGRENLLPYGSMAFNAFGPRNKHFHKAMENAESVTEWIMDQSRPGGADGLGARIHEANAAAGNSTELGTILVRSLLAAGTDTTVHAIGNAVLCFAEYPEQYAALHANPSLARAAFEEVIRYESPVQTFFRTTTRPADVSGFVIPEGEKVLMFLGAANRDERHWGEDAEAFNISRRVTGHVGFGYGIHACVGQMLARLEGECVLTALAQQVSRIELNGPVKRKLNNTLRGLESLPVTVSASQ